jgi:predicted dehydrogenase
MDLIIGSQPIQVFASGGQNVNHLNENYDGRKADMLDNAFVILDYADGVRAMLDLCMFAEGSYDKEILTVVGDEGNLNRSYPHLMCATPVEKIGENEAVGELEKEPDAAVKLSKSLI